MSFGIQMMDYGQAAVSLAAVSLARDANHGYGLDVTDDLTVAICVKNDELCITNDGF